MKASDFSNSSARSDPYTTLARQRHPLPNNETPQQATARWTETIEALHLANREWAKELVEQIAYGRTDLYPTDSEYAQIVFNELIRSEAFDLFEEVFTAYNEIEKVHAESAGKSFVVTLVWGPQRDWEPSAEKKEEMKGAFCRIGVQRLVMVLPPKLGDLCGVSMADGLKDIVGSVEDAASTAVSTCVVAMLKNAKLTELAVSGAMLDPGTVAKALPFSGLQSLELGRLLDPPMSKQALLTCATLLKGVSTCLTLTHLTLDHQDLVHLYPIFAEFHGPALKSVKMLGQSLTVNDPPSLPPLAPGSHDPGTAHPRHPMVCFMEAIANQFKSSLVEVEVNALVESLHGLSVAFLTPLRGLPALNRLELACNAHTVPAFDTSDALMVVAEWATGCPAMTDFAWDCGEREIDLVDFDTVRQQWAERSVVKATELALLKERLESEDCKLKRLKMSGACIPPQDLDILFDAIAQKLKIEHLRVRGGGPMSLELMHRLPKLLQDNEWLKQLELPLNIESYHLTVGQDLTEEILVEKQRDRKQDPFRFPLLLNTVETTPLETIEFAMALGKTLGKEETRNVFLKAPQRQVDENQRRLLTDFAYGQLGVDVAKMLSSNTKLRLDIPADVGGVIVKHLGEQRHLREVIHLSEVNRSTDHRELHRTEKRRAKVVPSQVEALVKGDNQYTVEFGLTNAPLVVNVVDLFGRNEELLDAVRSADAQRVRALRQNENAIDINGLVEPLVTEQAVAKALLEPVLPRAVTSTIATNNLGTTTTGTTASTTTAPTSTTRQERVPEHDQDPPQD